MLPSACDDAGADKEAKHWPCLLELACLLPAVQLSMVLVGPDLPAALSAVQMTFARQAADLCPGILSCDSSATLTLCARRA